MKKTKTNYAPPVIEVSIVQLEHSIASGSTFIVSDGENNQPEITDWEDQTDDQTWTF